MDVEYVDGSSLSDLSSRIDKVLNHLKAPLDDDDMETGDPTEARQQESQQPVKEEKDRSKQLDEMMMYIEEQEKKCKKFPHR